MAFFFDSLPEGIQLQICARLASACDIAEFHRFRSLSKTNIRLCDDRDVLSRASMSLPDYRWDTWPDYPAFNQVIAKYRRKCALSGNTAAKYIVGLAQFFEGSPWNQPERDEGLKFLAEASEEGVEEATKIYGLILICLGGANKQTGYRILSPFTIPLFPDLIMEMQSYWEDRRDKLSWRGRPMMAHLKRMYVSDNCTCNGLTSLFFRSGWDQFALFDPDATFMACEICLWHEVLEILFRYCRV